MFVFPAAASLYGCLCVCGCLCLCLCLFGRPEHVPRDWLPARQPGRVQGQVCSTHGLLQVCALNNHVCLSVSCLHMCLRKPMAVRALCYCCCYCSRWVKRDSYLPVGSQGLKAVTRAKLRSLLLLLHCSLSTSPLPLDPIGSSSVHTAALTPQPMYSHTHTHTHTLSLSLCLAGTIRLRFTTRTFAAWLQRNRSSSPTTPSQTLLQPTTFT